MTPLRPVDTALALAVVCVWGISFVGIKLGLTEMPPFALCAWRFLLAAIPLVFFVPRPPVAWRLLVGYGIAIGVLQFGLLFLAIAMGMPAGLSSIVIPVQVFFTIGLSMWLFRERVRAAQVVGAAIAAAGLALIGWNRLEGGLVVPFLLVVAAALAWAVGNVIAKKAGRVDLLGFIAWSSLAAPLPLALLSLAFEDPSALVVPLAHPTLVVWGSLIGIAYGATVFGFGSWSRLLARNDAAMVSPYALLIPVWGMASTAVVFGERLDAMQALGAALVIAGLVFAVFGPGLGARLRARIGRLT
jgi:O-acetylserine/cysteine efflux transporter